MSDGRIVVSTLKTAKHGRGRVLRLYESTGTAASTAVTGIPAGMDAWEVSVVEDRIQRLEALEGRIALHFGPWQVRTILIEPTA